MEGRREGGGGGRCLGSSCPGNRVRAFRRVVAMEMWMLTTAGKVGRTDWLHAYLQACQSEPLPSSPSR